MQDSVLITGASGGIGRALATAFAKEGYSLYLTGYRHSKELEELAVILRDTYSIHCQAFTCNAGDPDQVTHLFASLPSSPNILINNAGIAHIGLLTEMTNEEWDCMIATNLSSVFYHCREAAKSMIRSKYGRIMNISSVWGDCGASMEVAYSATKGGVNAFTKALAKELAPSNIAVNAIACGLIDTPMNAHLTEEELCQLVASIPADRLGNAEEVAELVVRTVQMPLYMTGQIIKIDGGWL